MNIIRKGTDKEFWAQLNYIKPIKLRLQLSIRKEAAHTKCSYLSFQLAAYTIIHKSLFLPEELSQISLPSPALNDERMQADLFIIVQVS